MAETKDFDSFGFPLIEHGGALAGSLMLKDREKNYKKLQGYEEATDEFGLPIAEKEGASPFDIEGAMAEIKDQTEMQIEMGTSFKWASRAIAAYRLAAQAESPEEKESWKDRGDDMAHEALEHAALAQDDGKTLAVVEPEIKKEKALVDQQG